MRKNTFLFTALLTATVLCTGCNKESQLPTPPGENPKPEEPEEDIYPVDFRFITLSNSPSIDYITNKGEIHKDYFKSANNFQIGESPCCVTQIEDRLYLTHGGSWADNGIQQVDPTTFKVIKSYDFEKNGRFYAMEHITNDTVVVGGRERGKGYNLMVGSLEKEEFILSTLETGFEISVMKRIGNKLFVAGKRSQTNGEFNEAKLIVFDCKNLTQGGMRTILEDVNLSSNNAPIAIDKNKNIWIVASVGGANSVTLFCVNPQTEKLIHKIEFPSQVTIRGEYCYTLDNEGKTLYVRAYKAFYKIDVDTPVIPEDPTYDYLDTNVSELRDLDITPEGTLLLIEGTTNSATRPDYIVELDPRTKKWNEVKRYPVGLNTRSIYLPKYKKNY
ncbi:MAG: hypothetical protein ACRCZY_09780 [Phocaeicola sp.]